MPVVEVCTRKETNSHRGRTIGLGLLALLGGILFGPAQASLVTYYFAGSVDENFNVDSAFEVGMPVVGKVSYDTAAPDGDPTSYWGRYAGALQDFSINIAGQVYRLNPADNQVVVNDDPSNSSLNFYSDDPNGPSVDLMSPVQMALFLRSTTRIFSSDALPLTAPDLSLFDWNREWNITFGGGSAPHSRGYMAGNITAVSNTPLQLPSAAVPESAVMAIFGLGLGLLGIGRQIAS